MNVGVLTLSTPPEGGNYTDSGPMSTRRQAKYTSPRKLGFGVLGCLLVDIGLKLHSGALCSRVILRLASSAPDDSTAKCTSCSFN